MTEAFPWETAPRYLLRDRDASYGQGFRDRIHAMGIKDVVTAPRPRLTRIARKLAPYTREPREPLSPSWCLAGCIIATNAALRELSWRPDRQPLERERPY
jgi:hypothetical protein